MDWDLFGSAFGAIGTTVGSLITAIAVVVAVYQYIMFINDDLKTEMINTANRLLGNSFTSKEEILVRGGCRIYILEKVRHPLVRLSEN